MSLVIKKIKFPESFPSSFAGHKRRNFENTLSRKIAKSLKDMKVSL